jgi:nucleoside-diphosphate-sugar epimerase
MKRILITGINGFVGSNFAEKWKEHHILYGLDINQAPKDGVKAIYG